MDGRIDWSGILGMTRESTTGLDVCSAPLGVELAHTHVAAWSPHENLWYERTSPRRWPARSESLSWVISVSGWYRCRRENPQASLTTAYVGSLTRTSVPPRRDVLVAGTGCALRRRGELTRTTLCSSRVKWIATTAPGVNRHIGVTRSALRSNRSSFAIKVGDGTESDGGRHRRGAATEATLSGIGVIPARLADLS